MSLAPGILIAAPPLNDANFERSVVLLASHDEEGAFGWVINGARVMSIAELLTRAEIVTPLSPDEPDLSRLLAIEGEVRAGGPVSPEQVWLIYPTNEELEGIGGQFEVAPGIFATASRRVLERLASGTLVPGLVALAGYAGWGPGQLENEIKEGAWMPGDCSRELVFTGDPDDAWERAYEAMGLTPMAFTTRTIGSA